MVFNYSHSNAYRQPNKPSTPFSTGLAGGHSGSMFQSYFHRKGQIVKDMERDTPFCIFQSVFKSYSIQSCTLQKMQIKYNFDAWNLERY